MNSNNQSSNSSVWIPAIVKFSMEMTTWLWLFIATFTVNILFIILLFLSIIGLGLTGFPGDKAHDAKFLVPGWLRIIIELIFVALFGIIASNYLFGLIGFILQSLLVFMTIIFEFQRYLWMLGFRDSPPAYITYWKTKM